MATKAGGGLDALSRDARGDASGMALLAAPAAVIGLVRVQLGGALAGATSCAGAHTGHGVQGRCKRHAVMAVRAGDRQAERRAAGVGNRVAPGARAAAVGRVRPRRSTPLLALTDAESMAARDQSRSPARSSRSSRTRCRRSHTPACCQSRSRRQHVIPEQPNTSRGPHLPRDARTRATKTIPRKAARSGHRGRPPIGFERSSGSSGATTAHISSLTNSLMIEPTRR